MTELPLSARRANTLDRLLDAAEAAFAEKGVMASSVEEICDRAGFTRGAFYSNFSSKDELCVAVLRRKGEEVALAANHALSGLPGAPIEAASVDDVIRSAIELFMIGHPSNGSWVLARMELRLYALRSPSIRDALLNGERQLREVLVPAVTKAMAQIGARAIVPVDQLLTLLDAQYDALITQALLDGRESATKVWAEQMKVLLHALIVLTGDGTGSLANEGHNE